MKNMFCKRNILIATCLIALSIMTAVTYSFYTDGDSIDNEMKLGVSRGEIVEDFDQEEKKVWVKNTGTTPLLVRANFKMVLTNDEVVLDASKVATATYNLTSHGEGDTTYWIDGNDGWYYYNKLLPHKGMADLNDEFYNTLIADPTLTEILVHIETDTQNIPEDEKSLYTGAQLDVPVNFEYYFPLKVGDTYTHEEAWNIDGSSDIGQILRKLVDNK